MNVSKLYRQKIPVAGKNKCELLLYDLEKEKCFLDILQSKQNSYKKPLYNEP